MARTWHAERMPNRESEPVLAASEEHRDFTPDERRLFGLRHKGKVLVKDLWIEVELEGDWRAAFRLVPSDGHPVVGEIRIFPADEWSDRRPGRWRAHALGMNAQALSRTIFPKPDRRKLPKGVRLPEIGQGVPSQLLRQVPFRAIQQCAAKVNELLDPERDASARIEMIMSGFSLKPSAERRADAWADRRYAELAAAYVQRVEAGSRSPVADVARSFKMKDSQARDAIHTARTRGLLTRSGKRGLAGGRLTSDAQALLRDVAPKKKTGGN